MKNLGASAIFYYIIGLVFIVLFLLAPYPHFNRETSGWYGGPSVINRITGGSTDGTPLEKVFYKLTTESVTSAFSINCTSNADCKVYTVTNQCRSYCGDESAQNESAVISLNNNRVCDPATARVPKVSCTCVHGKCVNLE